MTKPDEKKPNDKYFYFVGSDRYENDSSAITGAQIRARIPNLDPSYGLMREGPGNEPDTPVMDDTSISLDKEKGWPRFYVVPPANFGR